MNQDGQAGAGDFAHRVEGRAQRREKAAAVAAGITDFDAAHRHAPAHFSQPALRFINLLLNRCNAPFGFNQFGDAPLAALEQFGQSRGEQLSGVQSRLRIDDFLRQILCADVAVALSSKAVSVSCSCC